ncbi:MAG: hypothetical protein ACI4IF_02830 [Acutalibacteraceae bacterium]
MKMSKRILAVVLSLIMLCGCLGTVASASYIRDTAYCPTIVVPGLFQCETKLYDENGEVATDANGEPLKAPFFMDTTEEIATKAIKEALAPLFNMVINQEDREQEAAHALADVLGDVIGEKIRCDENGDFVYDVRATKYDKSFAELSKYDQEYILKALPISKMIDIAGGENLYIFSYASLGNMDKTVAELYDFIQSVKEQSGSDKVNLIPISQGGSIANGLMQMYADNGREMGEDINRLVFVIPALNGSSLIGEIYEYGILDDPEYLYGTMIPSLTDDLTGNIINIALRIIPEEDLNNVLDIVVDELVEEYLGFSTLLWGLCPSENYPGAREKYLLDENSTEIVKQTDKFYQAQLNSDANILRAIESGVKVFDIVAYNCPLYQLVDCWDDVNADGIIQLDSTSMGATSFGVDVELPKDYVPTHSNCSDPEHHNHKDPNKIVDVCTGLLPETTFYFFGQNHEKVSSNNVVMSLVCDLVTDESFTDVFSYPDRYPQFNVARNSRPLENEIKKLEALDTSAMTDEQIAELDELIAEGYEILNTTYYPEEGMYEELSEEFINASYKFQNGEEKPVESSKDLTTIRLTRFIKQLNEFILLITKFLGSIR